MLRHQVGIHRPELLALIGDISRLGLLITSGEGWFLGVCWTPRAASKMLTKLE